MILEALEAIEALEVLEGLHPITPLVPGIVFDTREGCGASLSMLGIVFDTYEEGEGSRKKLMAKSLYTSTKIVND